MDLLEPKLAYRLNPYNPFNWLKALWWVIAKPYKWIVYLHERGYPDVFPEPVMQWTISTYCWLPLFWIALGVSIGTIPLHHLDHQWMRLWIVLVIVQWVIYAILGGKMRHDKQIRWHTYATPYYTAFMLAIFVEANMAISLLIFGIFFVITCIIMVTSSFTGVRIGLVLALALNFGAYTFLLRAIAMNISFSLALLALIVGIWWVYYGLIPMLSWMRRILYTKQANGESMLLFAPTTPIHVMIFLSIFVAHGLLIWLCLLGGWDVLLRVN